MGMTNSDKKHYDVVIATPGPSVEQGYLRSLMDTIEVLNDKGISFKFLDGSSSIVSEARNMTAHDNSLKNKQIVNGEYTYNKIFWIDSDMGWTPEDFIKLYESELDILSGVYVRSDGPVTFGTNSSKISEHILMQLTEPFRVRYVGFGFICMKYGVMESVEYPWFRVEYGKNKNGDINVIGEDVYFLREAEKNGHITYVDPTVRVFHYKTLGLQYRDINVIEEDIEFDEADDEFLSKFLF